MKLLAALIASVALLPVAVAVGYVSNPDPDPLTVKQTIDRDLKLRPGGDFEEWLFVVTKGQRKGEVTGAEYVISWTRKELREAGVLEGRYVVRSCALHTTSGDDTMATDPTIVSYCTQRHVTREQVRKHLESAARPYGQPALTS